MRVDAIVHPGSRSLRFLLRPLLNGGTVREQQMRVFYRREWDERRDDAHDDWGTSIWYFEVEDGQTLRQLEMYANGNVLKYSLEFLEDEFGGLAEGSVEHEELRGFEVTQAAFDLVWALSRKTDARPASPAPS